MANKFEKGMDDWYLGKEIGEDPGLEYLQGYSYAESLSMRDPREKEEADNRTNEYNEQFQPND